MIQEQHPEGREGYRRTESAGPRESYEARGMRERDYGSPRGHAETEEYREVEFHEPREGAYQEPRTHERGYEEPGRYERSYEDQPRGYRFEEEPPPEVKTVFSTSGINIIAGLWLILAPFALGYGAIEAAVWNSIIVGVAVGIMALVRVVQPEEHEGVSWVNFVLGIWLLVSPFVLGLANIEALVWNNIIVGVIVLALAAISAMATRRLHDPTAGTRPHQRGAATAGARRGDGASRRRARY